MIRQTCKSWMGKDFCLSDWLLRFLIQEGSDSDVDAPLGFLVACKDDCEVQPFVVRFSDQF